MRTIEGFYRSMAQGFAEEAYENHFHTRRGTWTLLGPRTGKVGEDHDDGGQVEAVCYYDNNPYPGDLAGCNPRALRPTRDAMLAELRVWMVAEGIPELGFGSYPPPGEEDAGYTIAIILGTRRVAFVRRRLDVLVRKATRYGYAATGSRGRTSP